MLALTDPDAFRDDAAALVAGGSTEASVARRARAARRRAARPVARGPRPARRARPRPRPQAARAVVRTGDERAVVHHGAADGDVGARPGRRRRASASQREATDRLRHVAHIGVGARPFSYVVHGRAAPDVDVRVELRAPSGELWTWGPDDAEARVTGPALDFCLLVTQRRHRDDLAVVADGAGRRRVARHRPGVRRPARRGATAGPVQRPARLVSQAPASTRPRPPMAISSTCSSRSTTPRTSATTGIR